MGVERVVFLSVSEVLGGGELHLLRTARAAAAQVEVAVASAPGSPVLADARRLGLPTLELELGRKLGRRTAAANLLRYPFARRRLRSFLEATGPGQWTLLQYKWEELLWGGEVVPGRVALWEHGPIPAPLLRVPWTRARLRRAFRRAGEVFAWSRPAREAIVELAGRAPEMLSAGVDPERAADAVRRRPETRAELDLGDDEPLLVHAGRLAEDKGIDTLVQALARMPSARAVICGEGPARPGIEALAARLRVRDRVRFLGFVGDPLPYLAAADVTVLLSRSPGEGRPLVALESSAVGTPVLALAGHPAFDQLAEEGRAELAHGEDPATVTRCVETVLSRERRAVPTAGWGETAERFLSALDRHR